MTPNIEDSVFVTAAATIKDLPDIRYKRYLKTDKEEVVTRRPYSDELQVYSFPQSWSSTALGFGGIGGQAFTSAQTTVVICGQHAAVYFGRRLAYIVDATITLMADIASQSMREVGQHGRYMDKRKAPHD